MNSMRMDKNGQRSEAFRIKYMFVCQYVCWVCEGDNVKGLRDGTGAILLLFSGVGLFSLVVVAIRAGDIGGKRGVQRKYIYGNLS